MTLAQRIDAAKAIIGGRKVVGRVYLKREPESSVVEVRARLRGKDQPGSVDTLLASLDNMPAAIDFRDIIGGM
jgi:hypothetical protein